MSFRWVSEIYLTWTIKSYFYRFSSYRRGPHVTYCTIIAFIGWISTCLIPSQRCEASYTSCDRHLLGNIYQCTDEPKCRRTYLSQRDLQAHINHRHKKTSKTATAQAKSTALQPPAKRPPPPTPSQANFSTPLPANFNVPPPLLLSGAANTPPPNALLVAPQSSQMGIGGSGGRGNNAGPTGPAPGGDLATIAALAAAIQTNPAAVAAVAAAGGLNVSSAYLICSLLLKLSYTHWAACS